VSSRKATSKELTVILQLGKFLTPREAGSTRTLEKCRFFPCCKRKTIKINVNHVKQGMEEI